ncbi:MAG: hypothetical protein KatS3mg015_1665 [Fimbriimonadales bacterium]|nr:MAG: hypothetical protein KatS3mg015_1665 [Fimbriimonadales bacterium]
MLLAVLAASIAFHGATVSDDPRYLSPVEIHVAVEGKWDNPFDPNEVSVWARVVGTRDVATDVPGFWMVPYETTEDSFQQAGKGEWRIRFAPWNTGAYGVFVRGFDREGPGELEKVGFRVEGFEKGKEPLGFGYVIPSENRPTFEVEQKPFVPVGCYLEDLPTKPSEIEAILRKVAETGSDFVSVPLYGMGWRLERRLLDYDQEAAWRVDWLLETAQRLGLRVFARLEGGQDLNGAGWSRHPYAKERNGPCATLQDFWTSLPARQLYKKFLRYFVARNAWRSSLMGIQFFDGVAPPAYWLDEMSQVVYELHPYLVVQAALRTADNDLDSKRLNTWVLPESAVLSTWRNKTKKPILLVPAQTDDPVAQAWRQLFAGASAAVGYGVPSKGALAPLRDLISALPWAEGADARKVETDGFAATLLFDSAMAVYLQSPKAGAMLTVPLRRSGTYEGVWRDCKTGAPISEQTRNSWKDQAEITMPETGSPAVFVAKRTGR